MFAASGAEMGLAIAPAGGNDRSAAKQPRRARNDRFQQEVELYEPVKRFLESRGYIVKGEVRGCDVVAVRADDPDAPPVVVELKLAFTLSLVLQGVDRFAITDLVYVAVPAEAAGRPNRPAARSAFSPNHPGVRRLCRRLGLGLLAIRPPPAAKTSKRSPRTGSVEVILDPVPFRVPRRNKGRAALLVREHARRQGDPTRGGVPGGRPSVTAYRQEALRCAEFMVRQGKTSRPLKVAAVRDGAAAPAAGRILYRNVYGWFEPAGRNLYRVTEAGMEALRTFAGRFEPAAAEEKGHSAPRAAAAARGT